MSSGDGMIPVEKYHGTENDFLVVDTKATEVPNYAAFAIAHCDRETGLNPGPHGKRHGADGVLFLAIEEGHDPMRVNMELVQPDGSSAEMCGNGLRCAAYWASNQTDEAAFVVATPVGSRQATVKDEAVTVEMGRPSFHPEDVTARVRRTADRDIHRKSDRDGGEHGRPMPSRSSKTSPPLTSLPLRHRFATPTSFPRERTWPSPRSTVVNSASAPSNVASKARHARAGRVRSPSSPVRSVSAETTARRSAFRCRGGSCRYRSRRRWAGATVRTSGAFVRDEIKSITDMTTKRPFAARTPISRVAWRSSRHSIADDCWPFRQMLECRPSCI